MGTNFYFIDKGAKCDYCGATDGIIRKHIGKSSVGWIFHFELETFPNPANWKEFLQDKAITDEYDHPYSFEKFVEWVEACQSASDHYDPEDVGYILRHHSIINGYHFLSGEFS